MNKEAWLQERRTGIGGSDAPALMHASPYSTPLKVYLDKIGQAEERKESLDMAAGTHMEPLIAKLYEERTGFKGYCTYKIARHPMFPWILGHADWLNAERGAEFKFIGPKRSSEAVQHKDNCLPEHVVQCRHYMQVYDRPVWDLVQFRVTYHGCELVIVPIARDVQKEQELFEAERKFWCEHVIPLIPPPATSPEEQARLLQHLYPFPKADGVTLSWEDAAASMLVADLRAATRERALAEAHYLKIVNSIKAELKDATAAECAAGKVRWSKGRKNATGKTGARVFRATFAGEQETTE